VTVNNGSDTQVATGYLVIETIGMGGTGPVQGEHGDEGDKEGKHDKEKGQD
jgi:hypothetical protein